MSNNNVNYAPHNFSHAPAQKPPANPYYNKYPPSYPQQTQQQYPQEKPLNPMPNYQNNPNSEPMQYHQPQSQPHKEFRRPNNNDDRKFNRDRPPRQEFNRDRFKKKHYRKRSSSRSSSRSSKSHSHSTHVKRRTSESMKKSAAFKKMLKDKNNWECPHCKNLNFSKRIRCNRCHRSKPSSLNKEFVDTRKFVKNLGGPPGLFREGDWACSKCDNINFAKRQCCNRCGKEKDSNDTVGVIKGSNSRKKSEKGEKNEKGEKPEKNEKGEKGEKNEQSASNKGNEAEAGGSKELLKSNGNNNTSSVPAVKAE